MIAMNVRTTKGNLHALFEQPGFVDPIANGAEYAQALALMGELIEDYKANHLFVDILSHSIEAWEDSSDEFARFSVAPVPHPSGRTQVVFRAGSASRGLPST